MMKVAQEPLNFGLIGNIPANYHSADLRNFFSQFIESGGFDCFHYRHRPEKKVLSDGSGLRQEVGEPTSKGNLQNVKNPSFANTTDSTQSVTPVSVVESTKSSCTKCCLIRLRKSQIDRLLKMYNKKHWLDKNGDSVARICLITRVMVGQTPASSTNHGSGKFLLDQYSFFAQVVVILIHSMQCHSFIWPKADCS
jgi:hypothetical protein